MDKSIYIFFVLLTFFVFVPTGAHPVESSFESRVHDGHLCPRNSAWFYVRNMSVGSSSADPRKSFSYDMKILGDHDMHLLTKFGSSAKKAQSGEAILVGNRALLIKNIQVEENSAIDILDGAALIRQLVITLIDFVSEKGPQKTIFPMRKKITELKYPIKLTTQSASGLFGAPWEAAIDLSRDEIGTIGYDVVFSYTTNGNEKAVMNLKGQLSNYGGKNKNIPLPDKLSIAGWQQYNIGPYTKRTGTGTIHDYGTTYIKTPFSTLGELRKYIKEKYKE